MKNEIYYPNIDAGEDYSLLNFYLHQKAKYQAGDQWIKSLALWQIAWLWSHLNHVSYEHTFNTMVDHPATIQSAFDEIMTTKLGDDE